MKRKTRRAGCPSGEIDRGNEIGISERQIGNVEEPNEEESETRDEENINMHQSGRGPRSIEEPGVHSFW
jgi:hypothetical protein